MSLVQVKLESQLKPLKGKHSRVRNSGRRLGGELSQVTGYQCEETKRLKGTASPRTPPVEAEAARLNCSG
jgi:hypothetical protein